MLTEKQKEKTNKYICVFCGKHCEGYGNNPDYLKKGKCCNTCKDIKAVPKADYDKLKQQKEMWEWCWKNKKLPSDWLMDGFPKELLEDDSIPKEKVREEFESILKVILSYHKRHTVDLADDVWNYTKGYNEALDELESLIKKGMIKCQI